MVDTADWLKISGAVAYVLGFTLVNASLSMPGDAKNIVMGVAYSLFFIGWIMFITGITVLPALLLDNYAVWKVMTTLATAIGCAVVWFLTMRGMDHPVVWALLALVFLATGVVISIPHNKMSLKEYFSFQILQIKITLGMLGGLLSSLGLFLCWRETGMATPVVAGPGVAILCLGQAMMVSA